MPATILPPGSSSQGFWSYVHKDDEADSGRIIRLANDVVSQYEMLTGEVISLFLDKDSLKWGDDWRRNIDESLASVAFFIPVITPRYFMSSECRRELQFFAQRAERLGIKDLVLPLLYVDVPALEEESSQDDLIKLILTFQWEDWRQRRYLDVTSEGYRRGVADLARRLVTANKQAERTSTPYPLLAPESISSSDNDASPGLIDRIANAESALPLWNETLTEIGKEIEAIGKIMQEATAEINEGSTSSSKSFAHRLAVARSMTKKLSAPTDRIYNFGKEFVFHLHDVDEGFRAIIELAPSETKANPEAKEQICQFLEMIRSLSKSVQEGLIPVQTMIDAIAPIEKMSRDLRPVLRKLRQGLTVMVEARNVTDQWISLVDDCGIDCSD